MTPQQGYDAAKRNLVGYKVVMGAEEAKLVKLAPVSLAGLHGPASWLEIEYGMSLSAWAARFIQKARDNGRVVTKKEAEWLNGPASLVDAQKWLVASGAEIG